MEFLLMLAAVLVALLLGIRLGRGPLWQPAYLAFRRTWGIGRWELLKTILHDRGRFDHVPHPRLKRWYWTLKAVLAVLLDRTRYLDGYESDDDGVVVAQFDFGQHNPMGEFGRYWDWRDVMVAKRGIAFDILYTGDGGYEDGTFGGYAY